MLKHNRPIKKLAFALSLAALIAWCACGTGTSLAWFHDESNVVKNGIISEDLIEQAYSSSLSKENIRSSEPFYNAKGELCAKVKILYLIGDSEKVINLIKGEEEQYNKCNVVHKCAQQQALSENELYNIAIKYWGDPLELTNEYGYETYIQSDGLTSEGKYIFRKKWIVKDDFGQHSTTLDWIKVDGYTGEISEY